MIILFELQLLEVPIPLKNSIIILNHRLQGLLILCSELPESCFLSIWGSTKGNNSFIYPYHTHLQKGIEILVMFYCKGHPIT